MQQHTPVERPQSDPFVQGTCANDRARPPSVEIGASGLTTQLIHKEWPETVVRVGRGKTVERRGLFDIVVLAPAQFEEVTLEQFLQGRIEPPIVIEVGLDYGTCTVNLAVSP